MSSVVQPTPAPNVELELAKLANDAMQNGADPHDTTLKLHQTIAYLRQFPKMAEHATNALADGVATPADITRTLWPHVQAMQHANGAPGVSNAPTPEEADAVDVPVSGALANLAQGIPGAEAAEAGVRSVVRRQPYREALSDIQTATGKLPTSLKIGGRIAGAAPLAAVLPGSPVASGAILGGADQALSPDPDESLAMRGLKTAGGAALGAATGKALDFATALPGVLGSKNVAANILQKQADRAASAAQLYRAALSEGQGKTLTQPIVDFLSEPDIAEIVSGLKQTRQFANTPEESPEMLDAVYKTLSDHAAQVKKGLDAVTPTRPNIGRFRAQDIGAAKSQAIDAMSGTASQPGPMPSYRDAVNDFAKRSQEIDALKRGYEAVRTQLSGGLPTAKNLTRTTPQAFSEWIKTATPEEVQAARQGIQGAAKQSFGLPSMTFAPARRALPAASALLRSAPTHGQMLLERLQNAGLLTASGAAQP